MQLQTDIISSKTDSAGYTHLRLRRPQGFDYVAGQYVTLATGNEEKPRFLAIASNASETELLFVSRHETDPRQPVKLSAPQGKGFGCNFDLPGAFLFITHGTGISAVRSAVVERQKRGHAGDFLLYGAQNVQALPEIDCLGEAAGLRQLRAFSKTATSQHVQDILQSLDLSSVAAMILIGSKEMMQSCREICAQKDFDAAKIFSNY